MLSQLLTLVMTVILDMEKQENEDLVGMELADLVADFKPPVSIEESLLFLWRLKNKINGKKWLRLFLCM